MKSFISHFKRTELTGVLLAVLLPAAAYVIKYYALKDSSVEFTTILSTLTTMLAAIYGIFWFFPNYLQQKRIDFLIITTKEALGGLLETEEKIKKLFFVHNCASCSVDEQIKAQFDVSYSLTRLNNAVLLLKRDSNLIKNDAVPKALKHIDQLEDLLHNKNDLKSFANINLFSAEDLENKSGKIANHIELLKQDLLRIYDMGE